ncbi:MAG TPA: PIG-L family deacetylase [Candidatus Baltobacteraceae bacterium]
MGESEPLFVVVAHPDDWQIFAGAAIYEHLRDPRKRVTVVTLTAGDAGDDAYHWKARHAGAVFSLLRGLPAWTPYGLGGFDAAVLPSSFTVRHERATANQKNLLATTIEGSNAAGATLYSLHLPDGGIDGEGFAPGHTSLSKLRAGVSPLTSLWPQDEPSRYETWGELIETLRALIACDCAGHAGAVTIYAPDPDPRVNPGDHADHVATAHLVRALADLLPALTPTWVTMYAIEHEPENLSEAAVHLQRAAMHAYGGGYMAAAAGVRPTWRNGWEREYRCFGKRQYLRREQRMELRAREC